LPIAPELAKKQANNGGLILGPEQADIMIRKGIILAGGSGSRLRPLTDVVCKQLLPVYDKPMIYYPLSTLMMLGIQDILVISTEKDTPIIQNLLGDGSRLGIKLSYKVQTAPRGLADAFLVGEEFIAGEPVSLILGDNLIHVAHITQLMRDCMTGDNGAWLVGAHVSDPERFGVIEVDEENRVLSIEEKPKFPRSEIASIGLYFYDNTVVDRAKALKPSARGELEITDLNNTYLREDTVHLKRLSRGATWLDMGTFDALSDACQYLNLVENRLGLKIGCIEEVAYMMHYIDATQLLQLAQSMGNSSYGHYLSRIARPNILRKVA
jgi:glucose-1-phosphate thymidylyltransferase